jgi:LCP family protein required for cell wall assembly
VNATLPQHLGALFYRLFTNHHWVKNTVAHVQQTIPKPISTTAWFMIIVLSAVFSAATILAVTMFISPTQIKIPVPGSGSDITVNIKSPGEKVLLVMGVDASYSGKDPHSFEGTRTDTMMLVRVSPAKNTISVVSIPRDSKVYLAENRGIDKINAAHALGGPELAVHTVQDSFGIPVDNYVVVNFKGVRELVDAIGGVNVYIDKPMRYRDRTAKLFIDFEPGHQKLDGQKAEEFLRFRHDALGDIGRIRRQQQFIAAVTQKMRDPWVLTHIPELIRLGNDYVQTDLSLDEMFRLAHFARNVKMDDIRVATLPGRPSSGAAISYWIVDPIPAQEVLDRLILDNATTAHDPANIEKKPLRVGILYAPDMREQVPALVEALERESFNVSCQSVKARSSTQIIEHTGRVSDKTTQTLRRTDKRLGGARLIFAPVGTTYETNACGSGEDYTIILGEDIRS